MTRTPRPLRRLTAADLGVDSDPADDTPSNESEFPPSESSTSARLIPDQVDAPIMTDIVDHKLIRMPGRAIEKTAPIAGLSDYLADQFKLVVADLQGQSDRRTIETFQEAAFLLQNWSISKLLAFGAHLYLLESSAISLRQELMDPAARRMDSAIHNSRRFISSFEEWHEYIRLSMFDAEVNRGPEVAAIAREVAQGLAQDSDSVDPNVPSALNEYADIASNGQSEQGIKVGVISVLRSITNISISFTEYTVKAGKGIASVFRSGRALKLFEAICRFLPQAMRLASTHADYSWLLSYSEDIRVACDQAKRAGITKTE